MSDFKWENHSSFDSEAETPPESPESSKNLMTMNDDEIELVTKLNEAWSKIDDDNVHDNDSGDEINRSDKHVMNSTDDILDMLCINISTPLVKKTQETNTIKSDDLSQLSSLAKTTPMPESEDKNHKLSPSINTQDIIEKLQEKLTEANQVDTTTKIYTKTEKQRARRHKSNNKENKRTKTFKELVAAVSDEESLSDSDPEITININKTTTPSTPILTNNTTENIVEDNTTSDTDIIKNHQYRKHFTANPNKTKPTPPKPKQTKKPVDKQTQKRQENKTNKTTKEPKTIDAPKETTPATELIDFTAEIVKPLYSKILEKKPNNAQNTEKIDSKPKTNPAPKTKNPLPPRKVSVDNIQTKYTAEEIVAYIHNTGGAAIKHVQILQRGGVIITPNTYEGTSSWLKPDKYPEHLFGNNLYIHLTDTVDTRPWLTINQVRYDVTTEAKLISTFREELEKIKIPSLNKNIEIEGLHRKISNLPTNLLLFKTTDEISEKHLTDGKIKINNREYTIRKYIDKTVTQCTNCRKIGHTKHQCKGQFACGRCGSSECRPLRCTNNFRRCVNCDGAHASTYKNCKVLKQQENINFQNKKTQNQNDYILKQNKAIQEKQEQQEIQIKKINRESTENTKTTKTSEPHNTELEQLKQIVQEQQNTITKISNEIKIRDKQVHELKEKLHNKSKKLTDFEFDTQAHLQTHDIQISRFENLLHTMIPTIVIHYLYTMGMDQPPDVDMHQNLRTMMESITEDTQSGLHDSTLHNMQVIDHFYNQVTTSEHKHSKNT